MIMSIWEEELHQMRSVLEETCTQRREVYIIYKITKDKVCINKMGDVYTIIINFMYKIINLIKYITPIKIKLLKFTWYN